MFGRAMGSFVPTPAAVNAYQWASATQFSFGATIGAPSFPLVVRIEKESAPGSGTWAAFVSQSITTNAWSIDGPSYTQGGSYRVRYERNGVASGWFPVSTPDAAVDPPGTPSISGFTNNGFFASFSVIPAESGCMTEYEFTHLGAGTGSGGTAVSGSAGVAMGPYSTPGVSGNPDGGRARHTRAGYVGAWGS